MVQSRTPNEFWGCLLEKAYAKLFGCYEALKGGICADALTDFTGGMCETWRLKKGSPKNISLMLRRAVNRDSLVCTGIWGTGGVGETLLPNGLVAGHAYTVTDVERVTVRSVLGNKRITMVRIRNPWGSKIEWNGPWSDESHLWDDVSEEERMEMKYRLRDDGEFWMEIGDFVDTFDDVDICHMAPDDLTERVRRKWRVSCFHGEWSSSNSGGRSKFRTFALNPQFSVRVRDEYDRDKTASMIVELTQKARRRMSQPNLNIGFTVFPLSYLERLPLSYSYFQRTKRAGAVDYYSNLRAVSKRLLLSPGRYVIVPTTWEPYEYGEFMLRVWSEAAVFENDKLPPISPVIMQNLYYGEKNEFEGQHGLDDTGQQEDSLSLSTSLSSSTPSTTQLDNDINKVFLNGSVTENQTDVSFEAFTSSLPNERSHFVGEHNLSSKVKSEAGRFFKAVAGEDMRLTAFELQRGLNLLYSVSNPYHFSTETCKLMVHFVNGEDYRLGFDEFCELFKPLDTWTRVFLSIDKDHTGLIATGNEFRTTLDRLGFGEIAELESFYNNSTTTQNKNSDSNLPLSNGIVNNGNDNAKSSSATSNLQKLLEFGYANENGKISYSNFISAVMRLQIARDSFDKLEKAHGSDDWVKLTITQWLQGAILP